MIGTCHRYGIVVILDVVYNRASGDVRAQDESLYFLDRVAGTNANDGCLSHDKSMLDVYRFTRELTWLRRKHPALRVRRAPVLVFARDAGDV